MKRILIVAATTGYQTLCSPTPHVASEWNGVWATTDVILEDPWATRRSGVRFDDPEAAVIKSCRRALSSALAIAIGKRFSPPSWPKKLGRLNSPASVELPEQISSPASDSTLADCPFPNIRVGIDRDPEVGYAPLRIHACERSVCRPPRRDSRRYSS